MMMQEIWRRGRPARPRHRSRGSPPPASPAAAPPAVSGSKARRAATSCLPLARGRPNLAQAQASTRWQRRRAAPTRPPLQAGAIWRQGPAAATWPQHGKWARTAPLEAMVATRPASSDRVLVGARCQWSAPAHPPATLSGCGPNPQPSPLAATNRPSVPMSVRACVWSALRRGRLRWLPMPGCQMSRAMLCRPGPWAWPWRLGARAAVRQVLAATWGTLPVAAGGALRLRRHLRSGTWQGGRRPCLGRGSSRASGGCRSLGTAMPLAVGVSMSNAVCGLACMRNQLQAVKYMPLERCII